MTSTFTWLAHDEAERRRMHEAVELFREQGTLDDLGIGSVRDTFSNLLFPGTSVLHTRARYFLFIPWIYRRLEQEGVSSRDVATRARRDEIRLIGALLKTPGVRGVIGERARAELKLLPSSAYWSGLGALGFRRFRGTQEQYHRSFDAYRLLVRGVPRVPDEDDPVVSVTRTWHSTLDALAEASPDYLEQTTFTLTPDEAGFIRELVLRHAGHSYFGYLCAKGRPSTVDHPWLHPRVGEAPAVIRRQLELAEAFSAVIHGASLLYNLSLARRRRLGPLAEDLTSRLGLWADELKGTADVDWNEFWQVASSDNVRISTGTRSFVERWFHFSLTLGAAVADDEQALRLVERRERQTKHAQARLCNPRRLETWTQPVGLGRLDYRWSVVQGVINDVMRANPGRRRAGS